MARKAVLFLALALVAAVPALRADEMVPRPEHPRPDFQRVTWQNLNGEWNFALDPDDRGLKENWAGRNALPDRIIVPYPVESELSGVHNLHPPEVCWYLKKFDLGPELQFSPGNGRLLLHFGAVDYHAMVWLNGMKLGEHVGGYSPFEFDVTELARPFGNTLVVRVFDSKDRLQARGKQSTKDKSYSIWYTTTTGIWQTVWMERAGDPYIKSFHFTPDRNLTGGEFSVETSKELSGISAEIWIGKPCVDGLSESSLLLARDLKWKDPALRPWTPEDPALYSVIIELKDKDGNKLDSVMSYIGVRTIETKDGKIYLNGKEFYQKLLLDQGFFPGGVYTPKDDEAMRADCEMYKRMGFNGLRKHQKIEDPRFLYWCDKLGLVVWEEMPSLGFGILGRIPKKAQDRFRDEWLSVIERDLNHPSIIAWTVFNENWGIYEMLWSKQSRRFAYAMVKATREADPSRLLVDNSGGWHFDTDVWDFHHYLPTVQDSIKLYERYQLKSGDHISLGRYLINAVKGELVLPSFFPGVDYEGQPLLLSEYGGFGFYKTAGDESLLEKYRSYTLAVGRFPNIAGYCYTQPYDVEQEQNGLMTFDRVPKVDPEKIREVNDMVGGMK